MYEGRMSLREWICFGVLWAIFDMAVFGSLSIHFGVSWRRAVNDPDTYYLAISQQCKDANATIIQTPGTARTFDLISIAHAERCDPSASVFKHANGTASVVAHIGTITGRDDHLNCNVHPGESKRFMAHVKEFVDVDWNWRYRSLCSLRIKQDFDYVTSKKKDIKNDETCTWVFTGLACAFMALYLFAFVVTMISECLEDRKLNKIWAVEAGKNNDVPHAKETLISRIRNRIVEFFKTKAKEAPADAIESNMVAPEQSPPARQAFQYPPDRSADKESRSMLGYCQFFKYYADLFDVVKSSTDGVKSSTDV